MPPQTQDMQMVLRSGSMSEDDRTPSYRSDFPSTVPSDADSAGMSLEGAPRGVIYPIEMPTQHAQNLLQVTRPIPLHPQVVHPLAVNPPPQCQEGGNVPLTYVEGSDRYLQHGAPPFFQIGGAMLEEGAVPVAQRGGPSLQIFQGRSPRKSAWCGISRNEYRESKGGKFGN